MFRVSKWYRVLIGKVNGLRIFTLDNRDSRGSNFCLEVGFILLEGCLVNKGVEDLYKI